MYLSANQSLSIELALTHCLNHYFLPVLALLEHTAYCVNFYMSKLLQFVTRFDHLCTLTFNLSFACTYVIDILMHYPETSSTVYIDHRLPGLLLQTACYRWFFANAVKPQRCISWPLRALIELHAISNFF